MAITLPVDSGSSVLELLRSMSNEEKEEEENDEHFEKENEKKEPFVFSLSNKNSNQLLNTKTSSASTSTPSMRDEVEEKKPSTNIDAGMPDMKIQFRSTKKAPSPPLPDKKTTNVASFTTTEVMPSSRSMNAFLTK
jgi:hypothetical protein